MATLEQAISDVLAADSAVAAYVGDRVRPLLGGQLDDRPFLTYSVNAPENFNTLSGTADYKRATFEIGILADSFKACVELSGEVERVLHMYGGTTSGVEFAPSMLEDETDVEQTVEPATEAPVFIRVQTYRVLYKLTA